MDIIWNCIWSNPKKGPQSTTRLTNMLEKDYGIATKVQDSNKFQNHDAILVPVQHVSRAIKVLELKFGRNA